MRVHYYQRILSIAVLLIVSLGDSNLVHAQETHDSTKTVAKVVLKGGDIIISDLKESLEDGERFFLRPFHFDGADLIRLGSTAAITGASMKWLDAPIRKEFQKERAPIADALTSFGNFFGTGTIGGIAAATLYTTGLIIGDAKVRVMGRHIVQIFAYSGVTTTALKYLIGRDRPYTGNGPLSFHGFSTDDAQHSLPSGHTTVATAICSSLAADIDNTWASVGLYTVAATTVFARMYSDNHWFSDTFLGGVIGTTTGYWVAHNDRDKAKDKAFLIIPGAGSLTLVYRF